MGVDCPSGQMREKPLCSRHSPVYRQFRMPARHVGKDDPFFGIPRAKQII